MGGRLYNPHLRKVVINNLSSSPSLGRERRRGEGISHLIISLPPLLGRKGDHLITDSETLPLSIFLARQQLERTSPPFPFLFLLLLPISPPARLNDFWKGEGGGRQLNFSLSPLQSAFADDDQREGVCAYVPPVTGNLAKPYYKASFTQKRKKIA